MKKRLVTSAILLVAFFIMSCDESDNELNHRQFKTADNQVVHRSSKDVLLSVETAWTPTAVAPYSANSVIYLESATRQVIELNVNSKERRILFDLSDYEGDLNPAIAYNSDWGIALTEGDHGWYMIASPNRKWIWFNIETGEVQITGNIYQNKTNDDDNPLLSDMNFADFSGIGKSSDGLYISFNDQVYEARVAFLSPDQLRHARLNHIAGSFTQNTDPSNTNALQTRLRLNRFTHFLDMDGRLIFWDPPKLRMVYQNKIQTITGGGSKNAAGDINDFYGYEIPYHAKPILHKGFIYTPYRTGDESAILKIDLHDISMNQHRVHGAVQVLWPEAGYISSWTKFNQDFISTDSGIGNFHRISGDDLGNSKRIFGPDSMDERMQLISDSDVYLNRSMSSPLSIAPLMNDALALLYEPTFQQLNLYHFTSQASAPVWSGRIQSIATNRTSTAWYTAGSTFYFLDIGDDGQITSSYVPGFFRSPEMTGSPCDAHMFRLPSEAQISVQDNQIFIYTPKSGNVYRYDISQDKSTQIHRPGWVTPDPNYLEFYPLGMPTDLMQFWTANNHMELMVVSENGRQYLTVFNLTKKPLQVGDQVIPVNKVRFISGFGDKPIQSGLSVANTLLDDITSIFVGEDDIIYLVSGRHIYQITEDGLWKEQLTCPIPDQVGQVDDFSQMKIDQTLVCTAKIDGDYYIYSTNPIHIDKTPVYNQWQKLDYDQFALCQSSPIAAYMTENQVCLTVLDAERNYTRCADLNDDMMIHQIACNDNALYLSGYDDAYKQIWKVDFNDPGTINRYLGHGTGLQDEVKIQNALLGTEFGNMTTDADMNLYIWMKDTCTIWKLPASASIEADTPVYRVVTDDMLCRADAFAVKPNGELAIVSDNQLFIMDSDRHFQFQSHVTGDVIDMIGMGNAFVLMTTSGIYTWEDHIYRQHAPSVLIIGNDVIRYNIPGKFYPRMIQSPGENAILVPVFKEGRIIKIHF